MNKKKIVAALLSLAAAVNVLASAWMCDNAVTDQPKRRDAAQAGVLAISAANHSCSDVNFRPALPLQNTKNQVAVRVHNTGSARLEKVGVTLSAEGHVIGNASLTIPAKSSTEFLFDWTPVSNGYHHLTVSAVSGNDKLQIDVTAPVVSRQMYFPWFGGHTKEGRSLRYANVVLASNAADFAYWRNRGAIPCLWKGVDRKMTSADYAANLQKGLGNYITGPAGIMIDEMGGYSVEEILASNYFAGLKLFLDRNPKAFTALWICGSLQVPYCNISRNVYRKEKGINLLMLECYSNFQVVEFGAIKRFDYYDQRIAIARQQDVLMNTVITLGIDGHADTFNLVPYEIEDELRYVRRQAPEMPGVGFFHSESKSPELVPIADDLCRKYFIEPVIQVYDENLQFDKLSPKKNEKITVLAGINNIGGMDAKEVTVRIFVNGKRLAEKNIALPALRTGDVPRAVQVKADFIPKKSGYYHFRVEAIPNHGETVLDGVAERNLFVY